MKTTKETKKTNANKLASLKVKTGTIAGRVPEEYKK
jgi:hypothetical protein